MEEFARFLLYTETIWSAQLPPMDDLDLTMYGCN